MWVWAEVTLREGRLASLLSTILSSAMMKMSVEVRDFGNVMLKESYNNPSSSWIEFAWPGLWQHGYQSERRFRICRR